MYTESFNSKKNRKERVYTGLVSGRKVKTYFDKNDQERLPLNNAQKAFLGAGAVTVGAIPVTQGYLNHNFRQRFTDTPGMFHEQIFGTTKIDNFPQYVSRKMKDIAGKNVPVKRRLKTLGSFAGIPLAVGGTYVLGLREGLKRTTNKVTPELREQIKKL